MQERNDQWSAGLAARAQSVFERTLEALPDGVLLIDAHRHIEYANHAFAELWQIPQYLIDTGDDSQVLDFVLNQLNEPDQFLAEVERLYGTTEVSQDELLFKDGRVLSRRSVPLQDSTTSSARIWIFTDITEARNASLDMLTGLNNRRAYGRLFPGWLMAPADGLWRAVALMDVDHFKLYNDLYGHAAGDEVLRRIADQIKQKLTRPDDLIFRIGGEEFLFACSGHAAKAVLPFFDKVRSSIEDLDIVHAGNPPSKVVTASFGLALYPGPNDPAAVFQDVDAALYRAKRAGRNCVAMAPPAY